MSLMAKLGLDTKAWDLSMKKVQASTTSWAKNTARTFAAQAAGMMAFESIARGIIGTFEGAEETLDAAITYSTTTDNIQRLAGAARKARMPVDRLMDAIKDLSVKQNDALNGSKTWMDTLSRFGFTMEDLKNNTPIEMFQQLSKAVSEGVMEDHVMQAELDNLMSDPGHESFAKMRQGLFNDLSSMPVNFSKSQLEEMAKSSVVYRDMMNDAEMGAARLAQYVHGSTFKTTPIGLGMGLGKLLSMPFTGGNQKSTEQESREQTDSNNLQTIADGVSKMSR